MFESVDGQTHGRRLDGYTAEEIRGVFDDIW